MSCGYWNNLVLEASAIGSDDDFNTIDVTQNIFVVVDDNNAPTINSVIISPNSTTINNTVNITANVTDDLQLNEVKSQIESPNSSVINYTMSLDSGDNYILSFNATYDNGTYFVKIYAIDKSFNLDESTLYNFSVNIIISESDPGNNEGSGDGSGGGGGGGGAGYTCKLDWSCSSWSLCEDEKQTRKCKLEDVSTFTSLNSCPQHTIPKQERSCQVDVDIEETCNDKIQNQDETGIDCGGSCGPCFTIGITNEGDTTKDNTDESPGNAITGAFIGIAENLDVNPWFLIGIVSIIVSGLLLSKYFRKKPPGKLPDKETERLNGMLNSET